MAETGSAREIRFLESVENLKRVVLTATGRHINTGAALQVSSCLQQGRLFFEAATAGAGEIRPLLLAYGTIAFAKATVVARTFTKLEALPQSHGLKDVSAPNALIKDLRVKIEGDGVFQRSVDAANSVERLSLLDNSRTVWISTPSCKSSALTNLELSLDDILGRLGDLATLYRETLLREPNALVTSLTQNMNARDLYELRVDIPATAGPSTRELLSIVGDLKERFPFLLKLNFCSASFAWDHIVIIFDNSQQGGKFPIAETDIQTVDQGAQLLPVPQQAGGEVKPIPLGEALPCSQGGLQGYFPTFSSPVRDDTYLSEFTLLYLGTHLLGSLVRYRPQIWVHALYGTETPSRPRDDATRALIEDFLDLAARKVPQWCASAIRAVTLP